MEPAPLVHCVDDYGFPRALFHDMSHDGLDADRRRGAEDARYDLRCELFDINATPRRLHETTGSASNRIGARTVGRIQVVVDVRVPLHALRDLRQRDAFSRERRRFH